MVKLGKFWDRPLELFPIVAFLGEDSSDRQGYTKRDYGILYALQNKRRW